MLIYLYVPLIMFFCGLLAFSFNYDHFLITLLILEYIVLSLFWLLYMYLYISLFDSFIIMFVFTFWICEGALGLSLLVSLVRSFGNDCFMSFNLLQC